MAVAGRRWSMVGTAGRQPLAVRCAMANTLGKVKAFGYEVMQGALLRVRLDVEGWTQLGGWSTSVLCRCTVCTGRVRLAEGKREGFVSTNPGCPQSFPLQRPSAIPSAVLVSGPPAHDQPIPCLSLRRLLLTLAS